MGTGAVQGYANRHPDIIEVGTTAFNSKMSCESCAANFTIFKRKKICGSCGRNFCSQCSLKQIESQQNRQCTKCKVLISGNFTKRDLMNWKIRDLKGFLHHQRVSTEMCREKHDLVDLLVRHYGNNLEDNHSEHERHMNNLRERRRQSYTNQNSGDSRRIPNAQSTTGSTSHSSGDIPQNSATHANPSHQQNNTQNSQSQCFEPMPENGPSRKRMTLDQIATEADLDTLTVRQLKELLAGYFVNYKGCVEKWELLERVKRLWNEDQVNKEKAAEMNNADNSKSLNFKSSYFLLALFQPY
ncbi:hypothetical protein ScPMuIL_007138 [Solemya velum]